MPRRRILLLLKPLDAYPPRGSNASSRFSNPHILSHLDNRRKVHEDAINYCQDILRKKMFDWESIVRNNLSCPIRDVDLVVSVGGDGTLLQASHFMDDSVPVLGVNSDPTQMEEVEKYSNEFDASRSTGFLCAATVSTFEQVLDNILEGRSSPSELSRMSICVNSKLLSTYALNDVLIAHPCPATVSWFSFIIQENGKPTCPLVNCRSSGLRVSTAAGSTAAMLSAGGFFMPSTSQDLQYMVREPISPGEAVTNLMHGTIKSNQTIDVTWFCQKGLIYIDGSHVIHQLQLGDSITLSSMAPVLKVFLPQHLLSSDL